MKNLTGSNYKKVVRDYVTTLVKDNMTIFSLPYLNFQIERMSKVAHCCEKDTMTWAQQSKLAPKNCILYNKLASEVIGERYYDLVFLDLCGSISKELLKCITNVKLRNKNSVFIITLLRAREHIRFKKEIATDGGRLPYLQKKLEDSGLYLYKTIEYTDSSPMLVLFASLKKRKYIENIKL